MTNAIYLLYGTLIGVFVLMVWQVLNNRLKGHRLWQWLLLALASLMIAVTLSSCGAIANGPLNRLRLDNFRAEAADVKQLVNTVIGEPKTFNYFLTNESASSDVLAMMYEGLTTIDYSTGEIVPALAESWDIAEDGKTIIFTLKENLQWSDGAPLTVDDVVFTYNDLVRNETIPTNKRDFLRVGEEGTLPEVTKVNGRQVKFSIPEPFAPFLRNTGLGIMPKHALEESVKQTDENGPLFIAKWGTGIDPSTVVGNGPFVIKSFVPGERIVFEGNPHYWKKGPNGEQLPLIERMVWPVVSSQDAEFLRFRSGETDVLSVTPTNYSLMKRDEDQGGYTVYNGGPTTTRLFLTFNLNKGSIDGKPVVDPIKSDWFNEVKFRQAVAYAIDRDTMLNNIYKGLGELQNSHIAPQSPYFAEAGGDSGIPTYNYDQEKAKALLTSAGFKYNGNQLTDAAGNPVTFTLQTNVGNKIREAAGAQIKQNLAAIGIKVNFQPIDFNKLIENLDSSLQWDAIVLGFGAGEEPNGSASLWLVDGNLHLFNQKPAPGGAVLTGREVYDWERQVSDLYVQAAQELDETKRKALYFETQRLVQENLPFIHLVGQYSMSAVRNRVENVEYTALGGAMWNIEELKLAEN